MPPPAAFHAPAPLRPAPLVATPGNARTTPTCKRKPVRKPRKSKSDKPRASAPVRTSTRTSSMPVADEALAAAFEENVKNPLAPLSGRKEDVARMEEERRRRARRGALAGLVPSLPSVPDFGAMGREEWLELLVKGAWVGIGCLAGLFIVVHFVIVGDLVPK